MLLSLVVVNAAEISLNLTQPTSDISISQNETFDVTVDITCLLGDCGEISAEADAVSQIVSTTEGDTPFYTLINPQIITLNENESASLTWQITAAGEPNTYSLKVQAQNADASSETNPFSVQILAQADTAPPEITITSPTETAYNTTSLQINVTISENGSASYSLDGGANVSMGSGTSFNQNLNDLAEGRHTLTIYAADSAGNTQSKSVSFSVQIPAPPPDSVAAQISLNLTQPTADISVNQNESFNVAVDITCLLGDCGEISAQVDVNSQLVSTTEGDTQFFTSINPQILTLNENESASITWLITATGEPNTYSFKVKAQNADNNSETDPFSVQILAEADTTAPEITITSPTQTTHNTSTLQINVTISENGSVSFSLDGAANTSIGSNGNSFSHQLDDLAEGRHTLTIYAADSAGNTQSKSVSFSVQIPTPPPDSDGDGVADSEDNLAGNTSNINASGTGILSMTIGGNASGATASGEQEVIIKDNDTTIAVFSYDFDQQPLNLSKIQIAKNSTSILTDFSGQIDSKTLYIEDNNFTRICVKDDELSSVSQISSSCDGTREFNFTSCLGGSDSKGGITCTDEGSMLKFENLNHSGILGIIDDLISPPPTNNTNNSNNPPPPPPSPGGGGGSGGSGGSSGGSSGGASGSSAGSAPTNSITKIWPLLATGVANFSIDSSIISVSEIRFNVLSQLNNVQITVNDLGSNASVSKPSDNLVYKYFEINPLNLPSSSFADATIIFIVDKNWLNGNKLSDSDVILLRLNDGKWSALETAKSSGSAYRATTPGFSTFAIAAKKEAAEPIAEQELLPEPQKLNSSSGNQITGSLITQYIPISAPISPILFWIIMAILIGGIVIGYLVFARDKKVEPPAL